MAWWKTAKPGDKVVAIVTKSNKGKTRTVTKGEVYTIRGIEEVHTQSNRRIYTAAHLRELLCATNKLGFELSPPAKWFRPVQTQQLPESITRFLTKPNARIKEDALTS